MPAKTGFLTPTTARSAPVGVGETVWASASSIRDDAGGEALQTPSQIVANAFIECYTFNLAVPDTVDTSAKGYEVKLGRRRTGGTLGEIQDLTVTLMTPLSASVGDNKALAANWMNASAVANYGADNDNWGYTQGSAAILNSETFGIRVRVQNVGVGADRVARCDVLKFQVTYVYLNTTDVTPTPEYGYESSTVNLVQQHFIGANDSNAEFGYEIAGAGLVQQHFIGAQSSEYGHELTNVAVSKNIAAQSSEYGHELGDVTVSKNIAVQSSEYGWEVGGPALVQQHFVGAEGSSSEYGHEIANAGLVQQHFIGAQGSSAEYGYELGDVTLSKNVVPQSSIYGWRVDSALLERNIVVQSSEYGYEAAGPGITQLHFIGAQGSSAEYGYELGSVGMRFFVHGRTPRERRIEALV